MWALIEWCEEGCPLDVINAKDILQKTYVEGDKVDVKYEDESSPAVIMKLDDSKNKVIRALNKMEAIKPKKKAELPEKRTIVKRKDFSPPTRHNCLSPPKKKKVMTAPMADAMLMANLKNEMSELRSENQMLKKENKELMALNFKLQKELLDRLQVLPQPLKPPQHPSQRQTALPQPVSQLQPLSQPEAALLQPLSQQQPPSQPQTALHQTLNQPQPLNFPQTLSHSQIKTPAQSLGISDETLKACGRGGSSWSAMVKDLAVAVFGREQLATHGLSGKPGNANKGSAAKPALNQDKIKKILDIVQEHFPNIPRKVIRASLREKMNDEHKLRLRQMRTDI